MRLVLVGGIIATALSFFNFGIIAAFCVDVSKISTNYVSQNLSVTRHYYLVNSKNWDEVFNAEHADLRGICYTTSG